MSITVSVMLMKVFSGNYFFSLLISGGLGLALVQCDSPPLRPAGKEALKLTHPQQYAENLAERFELVDEVGSATAIPPGVLSPELYSLTERIYALIKKGESFALVGKNYVLKVPQLLNVELPMVYIKGGEFMMGSSEGETGRSSDELRPHRVMVNDFWMSSIEIPWELYQVFMDNGRARNKEGRPMEVQATDETWMAVSQPTAPYTAMNLGMGNGYERGFPAIAMSHYAAAKFCEWLSARTGQYYRLPTEAEWEYACRAGSDSPYSFGKEEALLHEYAWYYENAQDQYQHTARKKPNAWGLYDMHGNVAEWVLDSFIPVETESGTTVLGNPVFLKQKAPHLVKGGSWDDDAPALRAAARKKSTEAWNSLDPQNPKSLWYLTEGGQIGFRIVRPVAIPSLELMHHYWNQSKGQP